MLDKTRTHERKRLTLVKSVIGSFEEPAKTSDISGDCLGVSVSEQTMEKARNQSKALGWLYETVEIGWKFLMKSRAGLETTMGEMDPYAKVEPSSMPHEGLGLRKTLDLVENTVAPQLVKTQSPEFMGHMTSDIPFPVHLSDILISFFNQNLVKSETSGIASKIERQTLEWFHKIIYERDERFYERTQKSLDTALGVVTSGGTIGNISALTVARNISLPECKTIGLSETMKLHGLNKVVILCSKRAHYSLKKAASLIGLGEQNLVEIPVCKSSNRIDTVALEDTIQECQKNATLICAMVGMAGSTETGSVDNLSVMAKLASKYGIWFHVDAAWAGGYMLSPKLKAKLFGIEQADSVTIDGHKLLGLTMGHGMTLFKDEHSLGSIKQSANYIIRANSDDLGRFSLEGSRPFVSLKLWFLVNTYGFKKLGKRVEESHEKAQKFHRILNEFSCFEITSQLETNILTYRFAPKNIRDYIKHQEEGRDTIWLERALNTVNAQLHEDGITQAPGFVSRTQLESCLNTDIPLTVLRVIPINRQTKESHIRSLLSWQVNRGNELLTGLLENSPISSHEPLL